MKFADDIVKVMKSKAGPSSKELKSMEEVEKITSSMEIAIVGELLHFNLCYKQGNVKLYIIMVPLT